MPVQQARRRARLMETSRPAVSTSPLAQRLFPFRAWRHRVTGETMRADLLAGLISALVVLPNALSVKRS